MYIVVSRWELVKGKEAEAQAHRESMREFMSSLDGISFMEGFQAEDGELIAIICYQDKAAYDRIVNDPNGPFEAALKERKMEETMTWKQSWRGESMD